MHEKPTRERYLCYILKFKMIGKAPYMNAIQYKHCQQYSNMHDILLDKFGLT